MQDMLAAITIPHTLLQVSSCKGFDMPLYRLGFAISWLAILVACSRVAPTELVYSKREFSISLDQTASGAMIYIYTPAGVPPARAEESLNFIKQTSGVSTVPQVVSDVSRVLSNEGYEISAVAGRDDALCGTRSTGRLVIVVAARGERTIQLHHGVLVRDGNGMDVRCDGAAEVARLLDVTLASIP